MQNDSMQLFNSVLVSQSNSTASPARNYQCSHCPLILRSKAYLFEHLNHVHGLKTDAALKHSGLKSSHSTSCGTDLKCHHCDFIAYSKDGFKDHLSQCLNKSKDSGLMQSPTSDEKPDANITENGHKEHAKKSSKLKSPATSKHLKIYTKPMQTITKFLVPTTKSTKEPINVDDSKETVILQETSSSSTELIDLNAVPPNCSLQNDPLWTVTQHNPKTKEKCEEKPPNTLGQWTNKKSSKNRPVKKVNVSTESTPLSQKENTSQSKLRKSSDFTLSEDQSEKTNPQNLDSVVFFCKHCDYSDLGVRGMSNHYNSNHPYIRYNAVYIQDTSDESATFRCIECPVEFPKTADLKRHYKKEHPDAPNVFTKKLCELNLAFRCFVCQFTTTIVKKLKEHHDEMHPTYAAGSSLLYCRYSVTGCPKNSCQLSKPERKPETKKSKDVSIENGCLPCKEVKSTILPQPTSKGDGMNLFKCNSCIFSHKSVVVMHVHYQKSHPEEAMTMDKIKQLARFTDNAPLTMAQKKFANSGTALEKSQRHPSDSSKEGNVEPLPGKDIKMTLDSCQSRSKSTTNEVKKSSKKKKRSDNPLIKQDVEFLRIEHNYPSFSNADIFYCRFCTFESFRLESVVSHQSTQHFLQTTANTDEICRYSAEMRKKKVESKGEVSKTTPSSCSETDEKVVGKCKANDTTGTYLLGDHAYADPGKLFYCSECNFANPTARGIQYHQSKIHKGICSKISKIIEYTALVCKEVERSKSHPKEHPFSTYLPRPLIHKRDSLKFFCHFCNYRHGGLAQVLSHYSKTHEGFKMKRLAIEMYTSVVLNQAEKSHLIAKAHKEIDEKSLEKGAKIPKTSREKKLLRTLLCYKCSYKTQCVYLLRRHLAQVHNKRHQATEILKYCFEQGALQPGYHCEYCVFSHKNGPTIFQHYRERHPDKKLSLNYVLTQLRVGSPEPPNEKVQREGTSTDTSSDDSSDDESPSGQSEAKTFPCSECSFKGSSLSSVIQHFRTDHPWTETQSQTEDVSESRPLFDSFQEPLDFERSADHSDDDDDDDDNDNDKSEGERSSLEFKCPFCPTVLNTHHGLNTHCGLKHQNMNNTVESTKKTKTRVRLYKCRHCSYVNTCLQAILSHCQRKHSDPTAEPDRIHVDMKQVQNLNWLKIHRTGRLKLNAYMCTTCSRLCRTVTKLNKHRLTDHCPKAVDAEQSSPKTDSKPPIKCKIVLPKVSGAEKLNISTAFLSKKRNSVLKCLYCHYTCTTSTKLSQHVRVQHNKYTVSKGSLYTCVLCSKKYFTRKHLADHFVMIHGKDAYLTHFVPLYMQPKQTVASSGPPSSQKCADLSTSAEESKLQIHMCPFCPYVHTRLHGTLTHCQMRHPKNAVKADILQQDKIPRASFVSCKKGVITKLGGYMCKKCLQVFTSLGKYKLHSEGPCKIASKGSDDPKNVAHNIQSATSLDVNVKDEVSEVEIQSTHASAGETNSSPSLLMQSVSKIYRCQMCNYSASHRRYLQSHYNKFHKLDADTTSKLLQKYNKRKSYWTPRVFELPEEKSEPISETNCIKCPDLTFDSSELLIEHYCTIHCADVQMDFVVLSTGEKKKSTGLYTCNHCSKQLNGIKKLSAHMDRHRKRRKEEARKWASQQEPPLDPNSTEPGANDELPTSNVSEEFVPGSTTSVDLSTNHAESLSKLYDMKQSAPRLNSKKLACKHCGRSFTSPKVLRSHERSHATMAAIKNIGRKFTTELDSRVSKYIIYKSGVTKPFQCSICLYRTPVLGLWWYHFKKKHQDVVNLTEATDNRVIEEDSFQGVATEPPDLLKQPHTVTDPGDKRKIAEISLDSEPPDVRRQLSHYNLVAQRNAEAPAQEGRLRTDSLLYCEMCDFNTEHLSSIRRHYLNRHGKKIIRCKQCQFYTESRKVLEMHMLMGHSTGHSLPAHQKDLCCPFCLYQTKNKDNMIDHIDLHRDNRAVPVEIRRPKLSRYLRGIVFRCHRCTFMSSSAENLRLHMARHDIRPYKCLLCFFDCTQPSDLEVHLNDNHQVMRNHELISQVSHDLGEVVSSRTPDMEEGPFSTRELCSNRSEAEDMEEDFTEFNEVQQAGSLNQGQEGNACRSSMKALLDIHTTEQKKHELVPQARLRRDSDEQDQEGLWGYKGAEVGRSSPTFSNITDDRENTEAQRALNLEASVEDDILRNILELDKDGSVCRSLEKSDPERTDQAESDASQSSERSHIMQDLDSAEICPTQANDTEAKKSFTSDIQTAPPSILPKQPSFSHGDSSPTCLLEQELSGMTSDEAEMPVLENEYLKDKMHLLEFSKLQEDSDRLVQQDITAMKRETDEKSFGQRESQNKLTVKKKYSCELCGRKLASCSELELHTVRHGM